MKSRDKLGIKQWWIIPIEEIKKGDVVEIIPPSENLNKRYIVSEIRGDRIMLDNNCLSIEKDKIVWVIRWYPSDSDLLAGVINLDNLLIDFPDNEWEITPVFTLDMLDEYEGVSRISVRIDDGPTSFVWLDHRGWCFRKEWIIWDDLKFYAIWQGKSYFI